MTAPTGVPATILWHNDELKLLDQRRLPGVVSYLAVTNLEEAWQAINTRLCLDHSGALPGADSSSQARSGNGRSRHGRGF